MVPCTSSRAVWLADSERTTWSTFWLTNLFLPALYQPCRLSCPAPPVSPLAAPPVCYLIAPCTTSHGSSATVIVCLASSPGVGVPPLQLQHASLRLTREGTGEHLSHEWSNRRKALPTPLTALPSALWPLAAHPASVLVGVSCVQIAGVCWLCPTEVGWIEPVS